MHNPLIQLNLNIFPCIGFTIPFSSNCNKIVAKLETDISKSKAITSITCCCFANSLQLFGVLLVTPQTILFVLVKKLEKCPS